MSKESARSRDCGPELPVVRLGSAGGQAQPEAVVDARAGDRVRWRPRTVAPDTACAALLAAKGERSSDSSIYTILAWCCRRPRSAHAVTARE